MANSTANVTSCDNGWSDNDKFWTFPNACHVPVATASCLQASMLLGVFPMIAMSVRRFSTYTALLEDGCSKGKRMTFKTFRQLSACYIGSGVTYMFYCFILLAGQPLFALYAAPRLFLVPCITLVVTGISMVANGWFRSLPKQLFPAGHVVGGVDSRSPIHAKA